MNRKSRVAFGPGAASLIVIMVVLSMSVLGMLALMNARNEARLSRRAMDVTEQVYALNNQAERDLARLDAVVRTYDLPSQGGLDTLLRNLPQGMRYHDDVVSWEITDGVRTLSLQARILPYSSDVRVEWLSHVLTAVTDE